MPSTQTDPPPVTWKARRDRAIYYMRRLGPAGPLLLAASFFPPIGTAFLLWYMAPLGHWLRDHAAAGPPIYSLAFVVLGGLALMPTYAYSALGGWAFGFAVGFPAAMAGYVGGALVGYGIARALCGDRVVALLEEKPKWRAVYDELIRCHPGRALLIVVLVRLASSPFAVTNLVFAAAKVKLWIYVLGTLIGLSVRTGIVVWLASKVGGETFVYAQHKWLLYGGIGAAIVVFMILSHMAQKAIERVTSRQPADGELPAG